MSNNLNLLITMKMNRFLFGTLCATALFASCTNEELVTSPSESVIDARQIDVVLKANYAQSTPETRMGLIDNVWAWVEGDMIGALRVANLTGSVTANAFTTNYPFELADSTVTPAKTADFKTNTAVYEGQYVFYHQYNGSLVSGGSNGYTVTFPAVQEINPENLNENLSKNNLFVSPVIKLAGIEYNAENETAIEFIPMYAMLEVKITNNSTEGSVVVNRVDIAGNKLTPSGTLDFKTADGKFPVVNPEETDYTTKLSEAIKAMNENGDLLASGVDNGTSIISAIVKGQGITIGNGETKSVKVLIPAGTYAIDSSEGTDQAIKKFTVYTDKGKFEIDAEDATAEGNVATDVKFNHKTLRSLNPKLTGKASVVDNYTINNIDDWNSAVAYAVANQNKKIEFILNEDIEVSELPACPIYVSSTASKKLTFAKGSTITPAANSEFTNEVVNNGTLNLIEKATFGNLTNNGTINVAKTESITNVTALTNNGTIELEGKMTSPGTTWTNVYNEADKKYGTINVKSGAELVIGAATANAGVINNAGTITLNAALTNNANCVINVTTATGKFVGNGITKITNNGAIKLDAIKDVFVDADGKAVDNKFIGSGSGTVEVEVTPDDIASLPEIQEVNAISMSGNWTAANVAAMNKKWASITAMTWEGVSLDLNEVGTEFNAVKSLTINGTSTITTTGTEAEKLGMKDAANVTITVNGDLTIAKNVKIGSTATATPKMTVLGSVINYGEVTAQLTVGADKDGSTPANTSAKYTNTKDAKTIVSADGSTASELTLFGIFINEGTEDAVVTSEVDFRIDGKSTFTGSYKTSI